MYVPRRHLAGIQINLERFMADANLDIPVAKLLGSTGHQSFQRIDVAGYVVWLSASRVGDVGRTLQGDNLQIIGRPAATRLTGCRHSGGVPSDHHQSFGHSFPPARFLRRRRHSTRVSHTTMAATATAAIRRIIGYSPLHQNRLTCTEWEFWMTNQIKSRASAPPLATFQGKENFSLWLSTVGGTGAGDCPSVVFWSRSFIS